MSDTICSELIKELEAETGSTRNCLMRIPPSLFNWKPHEKSMNLKYLAILVADIPGWIAYMIEKKEIDFATYLHPEIKTTEELVQFFNENIERAKTALRSISDKDLSKDFTLKNQGQILFKSSLHENIGSSINHLVHHRGQLTVYMRLNNIPVPSIYGPSADEKAF